MGDAAGQRADFPTKFGSRFRAAAAFQTAQDKRRAILLRQALQLFVENRLQLAPGQVGCGGSSRLELQLSFTSISPRRRDASFAGDAVGDSMQPTGDGFGSTDTSRAPS
jgi:hypothetical protein